MGLEPKATVNPSVEPSESEKPASAVCTTSPRAHSALSLLADESLTIRRGAAEHILFSVRSFNSVPREVVRRLCEEPDTELVSSLLSFLGAVKDPAGVAPVLCARFISDSRPGVAIDAAAALGEIATRSSSPILPMAVLWSVTPSQGDPRLKAFASGAGGAAQQRDIQDLVSRCLRLSERAQKTDLKHTTHPIEGSWKEEQLHVVLIGLCSPGETVRSFALKLLTLYADQLPPEYRPKVWTSLSFVMDRLENASPVKQFEYFNAMRRLELPEELAPLVESFKCRAQSVTSMGRDFTAVYLARRGIPVGAVARTEEMLWSDMASASGGAASNFIILAGLDDTNPALAWKMVRMALEAAVERSGDGNAVVRELLRAFSLLEACQPEALNFCADMVARSSSPDVLTMTARLLGCIPWENDEVLTGAGELLQVLTKSRFARVAIAAGKVLAKASES